MSLERPAVGVLGLGIIGSRCAANLDGAGHPVLAWNRTRRESPVPRAASPAELARESQVIAIYLKDSAAVLEVFEALQGELTARHTVLNHATVDLACTEELARRCRRIGCGFLDCPFTGSRDAAAAGQLVYYASGDRDLVERMRQLLEVTAREVQFVGNIGAATTIKLATNLVSACVVQALAEGLALTRAQGLDGQLFVDALASNASGSPLTKMKLPHMLSDRHEPHFSLENMRKDSVQILALAQRLGLELPALETVNRCLTERCEAGDGGLDYAALARRYPAPAQVEA